MEAIKVLLVEDNPDHARLVSLILAKAGQNGSGRSFAITQVERLSQALTALAENGFEVVLLNLALPDSQGLDALHRMLAAAPFVPILVMSGLGDQALALAAVKVGAQDYLVKGYINEYSLPRAIHYAIERRRAELALRQSEAFTRAILNSLKAHIAVLNREGTIIAVNQAWEQFASENGDLSLDHTGVWTNYLEVCRCASKEDALAAQAALAGIQAVSAGAQAQFSLEYPCHSPTEKRWFMMQVTPLLDGQGSVVVAHENITERVLAEQETRRRNRELSLLNQIIATSAASLEPETILETACHELALAFDLPQVAAGLYTEDKTEAVIVAEYLAEDQAASLNQRIRVERNSVLAYLLNHRGPLVVDDALTDPRLASLRDLVRRYQAASLLILPLMVDEDLVGVLALKTTQARHFSPEEISLAWNVADQAAGALARARLSQLHRHLSAAMDQAAEAVVITDIEARIIYVNPAFERMTGYSRAEVIGQNPSLLKSDQQPDAFYVDLWATIRAGQVWTGRLVNRRKDGSLYTEEMTITPVRNNNGVITNYVAVKDDVTAKLQLEEQLRQSQKMEAIGRLAGGIAHDFNNLLTVITGYSELLLSRHLAADDPMRKEVEQISKAGERAAALTRQLLAFSRKQTLEPRRLNLNSIVADMDKMLRRLIGEDIELATMLASDLGQALVDPGQLEQILMNLAVNARDAMPAGGKLTLETANVHLDESYVQEHAEVQAGPYVMLAVSDTGTGMDKATLSRIFEPFFTTKEQGQGTGLGLATVYGIVKQSRGSIWVYSEPGYGTTFKIYLPRITTVAEPLETQPTLSELRRGSETIFIVEDEASVRDFIRNVLEVSGYTVLAAASSQEALALCRQYPQPIHLLLTDMIMPGLNGHKLAEQLAWLRPNLKSIFISGYTGNTIIRQGILAAGRAFLEKPFTPGQLMGKVREVLDGQ